MYPPSAFQSSSRAYQAANAHSRSGSRGSQQHLLSTADGVSLSSSYTSLDVWALQQQPAQQQLPQHTGGSSSSTSAGGVKQAKQLPPLPPFLPGTQQPPLEADAAVVDLRPGTPRAPAAAPAASPPASTASASRLSPFKRRPSPSSVPSAPCSAQGPSAAVLAAYAQARGRSPRCSEDGEEAGAGEEPFTGAAHGLGAGAAGANEPPPSLAAATAAASALPSVAASVASSSAAPAQPAANAAAASAPGLPPRPPSSAASTAGGGLKLYGPSASALQQQQAGTASCLPDGTCCLPLLPSTASAASAALVASGGSLTGSAPGLTVPVYIHGMRSPLGTSALPRGHANAPTTPFGSLFTAPGLAPEGLVGRLLARRAAAAAASPGGLGWAGLNGLGYSSSDQQLEAALREFVRIKTVSRHDSSAPHDDE